MNIAKVIPNAVNAYPGVAYEIYVSGCDHNCPGCHSPELHDHTVGSPVDKAFWQDMERHREWFDIISILGGDLLCQDPIEAMMFVMYLKWNYPEKELWLFTGKERENVPAWVWRKFDVVKAGPYDPAQKQDGFPASANQKIYAKGVDYF